MDPKELELPQHVSPDGRELWDWAGRLSEHVHREDRLRKLRARIAPIGTRCGDCDKWMKSSLCPQERNVNGYTRGPSCEGLKCAQFVEAGSATRLRADLLAELAKQ